MKANYIITTEEPIIKWGKYKMGIALGTPVEKYEIKQFREAGDPKNGKVVVLRLSNKITISQKGEMLLTLTRWYQYHKKNKTKFEIKDIVNRVIEMKEETRKEFNFELNKRCNVTCTFAPFSKSAVLTDVTKNFDQG